MSQCLRDQTGEFSCKYVRVFVTVRYFEFPTFLLDSFLLALGLLLSLEVLLSLHFLRSFVLRDTVWFIGVKILEPTGYSVVSGGYSLLGVRLW